MESLVKKLPPEIQHYILNIYKNGLHKRKRKHIIYSGPSPWVKANVTYYIVPPYY